MSDHTLANYGRRAQIRVELERLRELNAELLEALKTLAEYGAIFRWDPRFEISPHKKAMAAIAKAEKLK